MKKSVTILYSLTFAIFPVLSQYKLMKGVDIGPLLMVLMGALVFFTLKKVYIEKNSLRLIFFIYLHSLLILFIAPIYLDKVIIMKRLIFFAIYYYILIISINVLDREHFYKYYKAIAIIIVLILYYQAFTCFIMGNTFTNKYIYYISTGNRFSSVFNEPTAFAAYLIPLLIISIGRRELIFSLILIVALILSTSSLGIISCFFIIFYNFLKNINDIKKSKKLKNILYNISLIIIIFFIIFQFFYSDFYSFAKDKILNINYKQNVRFSKGPIIYSLTPLTAKIFGIGISNIANYCRAKGIFLPYKAEGFYSAEGSEYMNALPYSFLAFGIIGGILFLIQLFNLFKIIDKDYRVMPYIFLFFMLVTSMFYGSMFVFIISSVYLFSDKKKISKYILSF